jgi:hypothetical protein
MPAGKARRTYCRNAEPGLGIELIETVAKATLFLHLAEALFLERPKT